MWSEAQASTPALLLAQVRYENRLFWRSPVAAFFTILFPLMFLFLFAMLFGDEAVDLGDRGVFTIAQFYAPALGVFAVASATYTNIGIGTAIARDEGILKRFRGTPLPPWLYLAGKVGSGIWIAAIAVTIMLAVGNLVFDVPLFVDRLPAALLTFVLGAAAFAALGLMLAAFAPSGDSAPAIANATILPMAFVSDVFIIVADPPRWLTTVGDVLPLKHFVRAFQAAFSPAVTDAGFRWGHLAIVAAWGIGGTLAALRYFSWDPKERGSGRAPRRSGTGRNDSRG
jgi:ABC-2 type transport system permease protein